MDLRVKNGPENRISVSGDSLAPRQASTALR